jgi:TonB family protein
VNRKIWALLVVLLAACPSDVYAGNETSVVTSPSPTTYGGRLNHFDRPPAYKSNSQPDPYLADLQRRIKRAWFPPKGNESKRIVVLFKIHHDGSLSNLRIEHSSGVQVADLAALTAVKNAAPFRPLFPEKKDIEGVEFTFDYNVFNGGGHATFHSF